MADPATKGQPRLRYVPPAESLPRKLRAVWKRQSPQCYSLQDIRTLDLKGYWGAGRKKWVLTAPGRVCWRVMVLIALLTRTLNLKKMHLPYWIT